MELRLPPLCHRSAAPQEQVLQVPAIAAIVPPSSTSSPLASAVPQLRRYVLARVTSVLVCTHSRLPWPADLTWAAERATAGRCSGALPACENRKQGLRRGDGEQQDWPESRQQKATTARQTQPLPHHPFPYCYQFHQLLHRLLVQLARDEIRDAAIGPHRRSVTAATCRPLFPRR